MDGGSQVKTRMRKNHLLNGVFGNGIIIRWEGTVQSIRMSAELVEEDGSHCTNMHHSKKRKNGA